MARTPKAIPLVDPYAEMESEGALFRRRVEARREGKHKPGKLPALAELDTRSSTRYLVIGDGHAHPSDRETGWAARWTWLGKMIVSKAPDVVVNIGDMFDAPSLHQIERGARKAKWEGFDSLAVDMEALWDGLERLGNAMAKAKQQPQLVLTVGNHEQRLMRLLAHFEILAGMIEVDDLRYREHGWVTFPYEHRAEVGVASFSHMFPGGASVTGPRGAVTKKPETSIRVYGHTHRLGVYCYGSTWQAAAMNCGMYAPPESEAFRYAPANRSEWRAGILEFEASEEAGLGAWGWTPLEEIRRRFG
jgi:predicted phosphodiesterase